jgi:citrate synthase
VLRMISEHRRQEEHSAFIENVKSGGGERLMGFGHRVYKSYDPRARIVKKLADEVFAQVGMDKDLEIALELERIALEDEYFISRKLYPNVDFYTGLIYRSMAFPTDFFTVLFAVARVPAGWRSGRRWCSTRSRRSPGRGRSTWARASRRCDRTGDR